MVCNHCHKGSPNHTQFDSNPEKSGSNDRRASIQGPGSHLNDEAHGVVNTVQYNDSNNIKVDTLVSNSFSWFEMHINISTRHYKFKFSTVIAIGRSVSGNRK